MPSFIQNALSAALVAAPLAIQPAIADAGKNTVTGSFGISESIDPAIGKGEVVIGRTAKFSSAAACGRAIESLARKFETYVEGKCTSDKTGKVLETARCALNKDTGLTNCMK